MSIDLQNAQKETLLEWKAEQSQTHKLGHLLNMTLIMLPDREDNFKETNRKSGGWSAKSRDGQQWLQIDLRNVNTKVAGVATQGRHYSTNWPYGSHSQWISKYMLQYSNDGKTFAYFKEKGKTTNKVTTP